MKNYNADLPIKLSSIYYINNTPLLTLQLIRSELNLYYKCNINYFDSNFFFLQIDWSNFNDKTMSVTDFKNNIIFNISNVKLSFLIPVAMIVNNSLISFSRFIEMLDDTKFNYFEELTNCIDISNSTLQHVNMFLSHPVADIFTCMDEYNLFNTKI